SAEGAHGKRAGETPQVEISKGRNLPGKGPCSGIGISVPRPNQSRASILPESADDFLEFTEQSFSVHRPPPSGLLRQGASALWLTPERRPALADRSAPKRRRLVPPPLRIRRRGPQQVPSTPPCQQDPCGPTLRQPDFESAHSGTSRRQRIRRAPPWVV